MCEMQLLLSTKVYCKFLFFRFACGFIALFHVYLNGFSFLWERVYLISHSFFFFSLGVYYIGHTEHRHRKNRHTHTHTRTHICTHILYMSMIRRDEKYTPKQKVDCWNTRINDTHTHFFTCICTHMCENIRDAKYVYFEIWNVFVCVCVYIFYTHIHPMRRDISKWLFESEDSESSDSWRFRIPRHRTNVIQTNTFSFIYSLHVQL